MKNKPSKKIHITLGGVLCGLIVVALSLGMIFNYLSLNEVSAKLCAANKKYDTLVGEEKALSFEVEKQVNFTNIDKLATERLGMVKLQPHQVQYVTLTEADTMTVKENGNENALVSNLVASFNILVEYLK